MVFLIFSTFEMSWGQETPVRILTQAGDSSIVAQIDTTGKVNQRFLRRFFTKNYPSPKKALWMSFVLPGSGQVYNRKWWKLPLVYGGLGGMIYLDIYHIKKYRGLRDNYKAMVDEDPLTIAVEPYSLVDAATLKYYRDKRRKNVEQTSLYLGLLYFAVAADAFVDAHFSKFDVSDDLSLRVRPKPALSPEVGYGLGFSVCFDKPKPMACKPF